jgi:hypothetical protein
MERYAYFCGLLCVVYNNNIATVSKLVVSLQFAVTNHPLKLESYCADINEVSASIIVGTFWSG